MNGDAAVTAGHVDVGGAELYYERAGRGPAVVLLHAGIADLRMWDEQVGALADRFTVLRYDARGFGRTRATAGAFSNRDDLARLLDGLGVDRAALVGCSRGGMIALDFALERPERVAALGWVCSGVGGFQQPDEAFDPRELELMAEMEAAEAAGDMERVAALDVRVWVDGPLQPEGRAPEGVRRRVYEMALGNYRGAMVDGLAPQPLAPPAAGRLGELRAPVLAVVGGLDLSETAAAAALLAREAADVRVLRYPDAAHLPSMEQPARFNHDLREFLESLPSW